MANAREFTLDTKGLGTGVQGGFAMVGIAQMQKGLAELTPSLQRKYIRQGVKEAGKILQKEMKTEAPRIKGRSKAAKAKRSARDKKKGSQKPIWKSIILRPSSKWADAAGLRKKGIIGVAVGPSWPEGAHAHLIEYGHKLIAWGNDTGRRTTKNPFMRRSFDNKRNQMLNAQRTAVSNGLKEEARLMAREQREFGAVKEV